MSPKVMKKIIFYLLLLSLSCCKGKDRVKESESFVIVGIEEESRFRTPVLGKQGLDKAVVEHLERYMNGVEQDCEIEWDDRKCYTVDFYGKDSTRGCHPNDTVLCFAYYNPNIRKKYEGYRGVLNIANRRVAILDQDCVGARYYDKSKLERIPLESCESGPCFVKNRIRHTPYVCYLEDGWLKFDRSVIKFNYRKEWGIETQE